MQIDKQYVRRSVVDYTSPYPDPFIYRSIVELEQSALIEILKQVADSTLARDLEHDASEMLKGMIEFADSAYDPTHWLVAYSGVTPAGVVFSQRYHDLMHAGSLFLVGLTPTFRGKGLGKVIHARGLEELSRIGCELYIGSTDTRNLPMLRVFEENGCNFTQIRQVSVTPVVGLLEDEDNG